MFPRGPDVGPPRFPATPVSAYPILSSVKHGAPGVDASVMAQEQMFPEHAALQSTLLIAGGLDPHVYSNPRVDVLTPVMLVVSTTSGGVGV